MSMGVARCEGQISVSGLTPEWFWPICEMRLLGSAGSASFANGDKHDKHPTNQAFTDDQGTYVVVSFLTDNLFPYKQRKKS